MLKSVNLGKELAVTVINKIGILADISRILAEHGINIKAVAGYGKGEKKEAEVLLVTEDNLRASDALKKNGYKSITEREVIVAELENKPGALKTITFKLAEADIDLKCVYGTACAEGCPATIVLSTSDNEKALLALKK
jgi:hypothetical protein